MYRNSLAVIAILAVLAFNSSLASAGEPPNRFIEDFTTTQYLYRSYVDWDTVAAEARLLPFDFKVKGSFDTPGNAYDVAVAGRYVYVADDMAGGLRIIDLSRKTSDLSPAEAGHVDTPGNAHAVCVEGRFAYMADGTSGLQIIDVSDPSSAMITGNFSTSVQTVDVAVEGGYAYIAVGAIGVIKIDVSDPSAPSAVDTFNTSGSATGVDLDGHLLYVADGASGLQVVDLTESPPSIIGGYDTPGTALKVSVSGDIAFIADYTNGLVAVDVSVPASPVYLGRFDTGSYANDVCVDNNTAYVAALSGGMLAIDVSDPALMTAIDTVDTYVARGVTVSGEYAYVADHSEGLKIIDVFDPAHMLDVLAIGTGDATNDIFIRGNYACFVGDEDLGIFDISDPDYPVMLGTRELDGSALSIFVHGPWAYVCEGTSGLEIINISNTSKPGPSYNHSIGDARDVAVWGSYAYIANYSGGFQVVDISDPASPSYVADYVTSGSAICIRVRDNLAYIGTTAGLEIFDISNPGAATPTGAYSVEGTVYGFDLEGDRAYVADGSYGFKVIDVSDPSSPSLVIALDTPGSARSIEVDGEMVLIFDLSGGVLLRIEDDAPYDGYTAAEVWEGVYGVKGDLAGGYVFACDGGSYQMYVGQYKQRTFNQDFPVLSEPPAYYVSEPLFLNSDYPNDYYVIRARINAQCTGGFRFYGLNYLDGVYLEPGIWTMLNPWYGGINFYYDAYLDYVDYLVNPTVTEVQIDMLFNTAVIDSVTDVPADQGGWARLYFTRSGFDFPTGETPLPITGYYLWRRVDDPALSAMIIDRTGVQPSKEVAASALSSRDIEPPSRLDEMSAVELDGRVFVGAAAGDPMPDGLWEIVGHAPAHNLDSYIFLVPMIGDSAATIPWSVFCITTEMDGGDWIVSMPDSGYSVDNIPPSVPTGVSVAYNAPGGNEISWEICPDNDFEYFRVYRSTVEDFVPEPSDIVQSTTSASWLDDVEDGHLYYYIVTAVDHNGNESGLGLPATVTGEDIPGVLGAFALLQNVPNPFNPSTTIRFDLPSSSRVTLVVYNVRGERVATLIDSHIAAGSREITWNGTADSGSRVASGIYFYRLTAPGFAETRKMVLLR